MKKIRRVISQLALSALVLTLGCSKQSLDQLDAKSPPSNKDMAAVKEIEVSLFVNPTTPTTYYVAPPENGGNDNNTGAIDNPITLQFAANQSQPGDVILLKSGIYYTTNLTAALRINVSGLATNFITYKAATGQFPIIKATGSVFEAIRVKASHIIIDGIELIGNNESILYEDAYSSFQFAYNNGGEVQSDPERFGRYNTCGINIGLSPADYEASPGSVPHNITVRNCKVHDFASSGLVAQTADLILFEDNVVYGNCLYTMYGGSGISTKNMVDWNGVGSSNSYKTVIQRNICYDNKSLIPYLFDKTKLRFSDGNGIIIDSHVAGPVSDVYFPEYIGRTLVANNVCYMNGGSGAHALKAPHTDIVNNTCYYNGQTSGANSNYPNVYAKLCSGDVRIFNNIAVAKFGGRCTSNEGNGSGVVYGFNYLYAASATVIDGPAGAVVAGGTGSGDVNQVKSASNPNPVLPNFVNVGAKNFNVNFPSFSINAGKDTSSPLLNSLAPYPFPSQDIQKLTRLISSRVDMGAYEYGN